MAVGVNERDGASMTLYNTLLYLAPGDGSTLTVVDTGFGRIGGLICWENYMSRPVERPAVA